MPLYVCNLSGNNIEQILCDVLDNGLIIKIRILLREGPGKMFSKFLNSDGLKASHSVLHF